jgi:hypothetical protein
MKRVGLVISFIFLVVVGVTAVWVEYKLAMRFGITFSIATVCGLLAIVAALLRAPEGYEDENSFHIRARRKQERLPRYVPALVIRFSAATLVGVIGIAGALTILLTSQSEKIASLTPTIKVPGPYPYETSMRIAPPLIAESSPSPLPTPFPYPKSSPSLSTAQARHLRIANTHRALTAKTVREAVFKYNGVANFCGFLAALPADVRVFDPKLGRTRALVKGDRMIPKNVAWLRKREQARRAQTKPNSAGSHLVRRYQSRGITQERQVDFGESA